MKRKLIAVLLCAMLAVSAAGLAVSAADADNKYTVSMDNGNEAGVLAYGRTEKQTLDALTAKIADINAKVTELNKAKKDLAAAYAKGEIPAYSKKNDGIITKENNRSNFKTWDGRPVADLKFLNDGYDGWGDASVGWLCYNAKADEGVIVAGKFAKKYENYGKIGVPLSDRFVVYDNGTEGGYTAYQNFSNGYFKSVNGADCTVVLKKTVVKKQGVTGGSSQADWVEERYVEENAAGYVGAAPNKILNDSGITGQQFADLYAQAYSRYAAKDIEVGYAFTNVGSFYGGLTGQNFRHGSSVCSPWDDDKNGDRARWSMLAYNNELTEVYLIKDEFFFALEAGSNAHKEAAKKLGAPAGEEFVYDGNRYQNFAGGYMKAAGTAAKNADITEIVVGKKIGADGAVTDISLKDKVGSVSVGVTLPEGYTRETLGAAFCAAYETHLKDFALDSLDQVKMEDGVILQVYKNGKNEAVALAYDKVNDEVRYLGIGSYGAYSASSGLGCPTTESFQVAKGSDSLPAVYAQSFENGYIKIKVTTQEDIDEDGNVISFTKEIGTPTIGATYDAEKGVFETTNYSDKITKVAGDVASAYDFLEVPANDRLLELFREAYNKAFGIGFSCGLPSDEGIVWWTTGQSGVVKLTLKGGNGNANFWGDNTIMLYDCDNGVVRISTSTVANIYANDGASGNGWATTEMMLNTKTGTIVQQFNISDPVVKNRKIYIIIPEGDPNKASKVSGVYDFEANTADGEWVEYLTQFGGDSISAKPVTVDSSYLKGSPIAIDFASFLNNAANYSVKFELAEGVAGAIDAATGAYTLTPDAIGTVEVEVVAYTAFDKVTLKATLNVTQGGGGTPEPSDPGKAGCGCGTLGLGGGAGLMGGLLLLAGLAGGTLLFVKRRALKKN